MNEWTGKCHFGDVRDVLRRMIADGVKVNTIVTSPPYWGLRSYLPADHPDKAREIGSEPTLGEFLETMVGVFDLCREVLADDGTMWVNMGDSYATGTTSNRSPTATGKHGYWQNEAINKRIHGRDIGLKPKDLVGQPWRIAFALQDAGWWLRQDIIWGKPNPMPESVTDRCTKSHEYLFLLAKNGNKKLLWRAKDTREWVYSKPDLTQTVPAPLPGDPDRVVPRWEGYDYYYDFDAMQEPVNGNAKPRRATIKAPDGWATHADRHGSFHKEGREKGTTVANVGRREGPPGNPAESKFGTLTGQNADGAHRTKAGLNRKLAEAGSGTKNNDSMDEALAEMRDTRNRRSVWTVPSEPFSGAHFATFPRALIEPCILAGAPAGGVVLDIFMGSGTTAQVAEKLGRKWIGIDIDIRNKQLQDERLRQPSLDMEPA